MLMIHAREPLGHILQLVDDVILHKLPRHDGIVAEELQLKGPRFDPHVVRRGLVRPVPKFDALRDQLEEVGHPLRGSCDGGEEPEGDECAGGDGVDGFVGVGVRGQLLESAGAAGNDWGDWVVLAVISISGVVRWLAA